MSTASIIEIRNLPSWRWLCSFSCLASLHLVSPLLERQFPSHVWILVQVASLSSSNSGSILACKAWEHLSLSLVSLSNNWWLEISIYPRLDCRMTTSFGRRNERFRLNSASSELLLLLQLVIFELELVFFFHDSIETSTQALILDFSLFDLWSQVAYDLAKWHFRQLLLFSLAKMKHFSISVIDFIDTRAHFRNQFSNLCLTLQYLSLLSFSKITVFLKNSYLSLKQQNLLILFNALSLKLFLVHINIKQDHEESPESLSSHINVW